MAYVDTTFVEDLRLHLGNDRIAEVEDILNAWMEQSRDETLSEIDRKDAETRLVAADEVLQALLMVPKVQEDGTLRIDVLCRMDGAR